MDNKPHRIEIASDVNKRDGIGIEVYLDDEMVLETKIEKFKGDEVEQKNTAYKLGASNKGIYSIMDKLIRTGSRIAITISEKI